MRWKELRQRPLFEFGLAMFLTAMLYTAIFLFVVYFVPHIPYLDEKILFRL